MTEIDPARLSAAIDDATEVRAHAPSLYAVLTTVGPLVETAEENAPNLWAESVDLRRSEKATVMDVLAVAIGAVCTIVTEVEAGDVAGAAAPEVGLAADAGAEMGERLRAAADALRARERRT